MLSASLSVGGGIPFGAFCPNGMSNTVKIEGAEERLKQLEALSIDNDIMRQRVDAAMKTMLKEVAKTLQSQATRGLMMQSDPRQAYRAVKFMVYKRVRGGNVSLLNRRKKGSRTYPLPVNKRQNGNGRPRTPRTEQLLSYFGADRAFVLRFLNQGTKQRTMERGGNVADRPRKGKGTGNRGAIAARNWFAGASQKELERAAENLAQYIDDIVAGMAF